MSNTDMNPWANEDAKRAVGYAIWHQQARAAFEADKTPGLANAMVRVWEIRDAHQEKTGWSAEPLDDGRWRFTYMDPATRLTGGQPVTITTTEDPK